MVTLPAYIKPQLIFPIKGCFYYDAWLALDNGWLNQHAKLVLKLEPENAHDPYAVQIWLQLNNDLHSDKTATEMLIGYVPRIISRYVNERWRNLTKRHVEIQPLVVTHLGHVGRSIEIDCYWSQINLDVIAHEDDLLQRFLVIGKLIWLHWVTQLRRWWRKKQSHYYHKPKT